MNVARNTKGQFLRKTEPVGIVDAETARLAAIAGIEIATGTINKKDGRVRIRRVHKFPGSFADGQALRSRVVWWLNTGEVFGLEFDIHHINEIRTDDRFTNLEKRDHAEHGRHHNPHDRVHRKCEICTSEFWIWKYRAADGARGRFCSPRCAKVGRRWWSSSKGYSYLAAQRRSPDDFLGRLYR